MPRFHFNVRDGENFPDLEGSELATVRAARLEAVRLSGASLAEKPEKFWSGTEWCIEVTNDAGLILFRLDFVATDAPAMMEG